VRTHLTVVMCRVRSRFVCSGTCFNLYSFFRLLNAKPLVLVLFCVTCGDIP
jgi:hypothetical protein